MSKVKFPSSPPVSILTPVFNAARFLTATIDSVCAQTYPHWTLYLILDPLSGDESGLIAHAYARRDPRIRVLTAASPGVSAARNCGLENAEDDYIAFLDSDDVWLPEKLARQVRVLEGAAGGFCSTSFRRIDTGGVRVGRVLSVPPRISYQRLLQQNCILCSSVMLNRRRVGKVRFPEMGCEDFALWLSLLQGGSSCIGLQQDLVRYRIVLGSRGSDKWRSLRETWIIYRQREKLNRLRASATLGIFVVRGLARHWRF